jgi:hypothetical protein
MKRNLQLTVAIGFALAAVVVAVGWGRFTEADRPALQEHKIQDESWETVRIRAELPDADFVYVLSTCPSCKAANQRVKRLGDENPDLKFVWVHPDLVNLLALQGVLGQTYGVDTSRAAVVTPVLYGPARAWIGVNEVTNASLEGALDGPRPFERMGASWVWLKKTNTIALQRFQQFQWQAIALAGLVDGINPCAISTILFLLSYLTLAGMQKSGLRVGLLFALGCFATYFVIGVGLWKLSNMATGAVWGRRLLYPAIAFMTVTVAALAFIECAQLLLKGTSETVLKLPNSVLRRTHDLIRRTVKAKHALLLAAPVGILVTLIEFGCTGQVYLPTITYVASIPGQKLTVLPVLLVYNIAFILPLLVVVVGHRFAAARFDKPRAPVPLQWVRLAEGILLGAIGAFMLWATYHAWMPG